MKKVLITGQHSYIGTSFANYIREDKDLTVDSISLRDNEWKNHDFSVYDVVVHTAGIAHSDSGKISPERAKEYYRVNTDLTVDLAEKAKSQGVSQFIYFSSIIIFGESAPMGKTKVITDQTIPSPKNAYGDSKLQAENKILPLMSEDFSVCVVRPLMVYGPESKGNYPILSKFAKKMPVFPKVENQRSMIFITNLCEFIRLMIVHEERGIFMPQNEEYVVTSHLVEAIAHSVGKKIWLTSLFNLPLKILSPFVGVVNKVFGSLVYEKALSQYRERYWLVGFEESVGRRE